MIYTYFVMWGRGFRTNENASIVEAVDYDKIWNRVDEEHTINEAKRIVSLPIIRVA